MRSFVEIVDHILQHGAFYLQNIDLLLVLNKSIHYNCILRGALMLVFMDFGGYKKSEVFYCFEWIPHAF
jgi:hypothetical protein